MKKAENPGKRKRMYMAMFIVATAIASLLFIFFNQPDWRWVLSAYFYTFAFWLGNYYFSFYAIKRYPRLENTRKRFFFSLLFVLLYTLVVILAWEGIIFQYQVTIRKLIALYLFGVVITVMISSLNGAIAFFNLFRRSIEEKEAIKRSQIESELNVLISQVNPHFLFNSLNTLMSLIPENAELAVSFTQKLSDVYRYSLQGRKKDLVTLEEELTMCRKYVFLMKTRFGDNLRIEEDIPDKYKLMKIPVLSLQLIIENAVKHNVISKDKPLTIRMKASDDYVEVFNNRNRKQEKEPGTGTGLDNIRQRYALYTEHTVTVKDENDFFSIEIPLIEVLKYESADYRR